MTRWRKKDDDDDVLTFDDIEEPDGHQRYRKPVPRHINTNFDYEEQSGPTFDELELKIRSGKYKPKAKDPWNAHVLYQTLKDLGEI